MKQKAISLAMAVLMMCALTTAAMAQGIIPLWDNTNACNATLSFTGTTANCRASIVGKNGTAKITAQMFLQELKSSGYETIVTWSSRTTTNSTLNLTGEAIRREPGVTYRLGVTAAVTNSAGQTETITVYSDPVECP